MKDTKQKWWKDAKLGMFIHWGLYSIPAGEWQGRQTPGIGEWIMKHLEIPVADYRKLARSSTPCSSTPSSGCRWRWTPA